MKNYLYSIVACLMMACLAISCSDEPEYDPSSHAMMDQDEYEFMVKFGKEMRLDKLASGAWDFENPLSWSGVTYEVNYLTRMRYVSKIEINGDRMNASIGWKESRLPDSGYACLKHLEEFSLHGLDFQQAELPGDLFDTPVNSINIHYCNISGSIPAEVGNAKNLTYLGIVATPISAIPAEIGELPRLESFDMILTDVTRIPPEIGKLKETLESMDFHNSKLNMIPEELGLLTNLKLFNAQCCQLQGEVPLIFNNIRGKILLNINNYSEINWDKVAAGYVVPDVRQNNLHGTVPQNVMDSPYHAIVYTNLIPQKGNALIIPDKQE